MKNLLPLCFLLLLFTGCKNGSEENSENSYTSEDPVTTKIAYANGFQNFDEVEQLNFTFNVKVGDTIRSQREWKWFPGEERVELTEKGTTASYINDGDLTEEEKAIDQKFINDSYWLLFPFHLMWSEYEFDHSPGGVAPISQQPMEEVIIKFTNEGGYTPGDTYHLFLKDNVIQEWTYVSSSGRSLSTTWEDYETFGGISIAKMHKGPDGNFQLYFTDIEVQLE